MNKPVLKFAAWMARRLPPALKRQIYGIKPLSGLIRRSLNRAAPQGLTAVKVAAGLLEGIEITLDLQCEKDYWLGTYEPELQFAIGELIKPGWVVYDIGANIGYVSLMLARVVGETGKIFAFEALPANLERLGQNLHSNNLGERVQIIPMAVVDAPRNVRFYVGPSGGMGKADGSAGREEFTYSDEVAVTGISLDHFIYQTGYPPPQAVKIDIEGGEVLALPGMQRLLTEAKPVVLLELHGPQAASAVWGALVAADYQVCRMQPGFPAVTALKDLDWKSYVVGIPLG